MSDRTNTGLPARNQEEYGAPLIIAEPPLQVLPSLAEAIGLECAIVYQQLYYLLRHKGNGREINGKRWIYNTYEEWHAMFPFWSERTLRRIFTELEQMLLVESCQPDGRQSRRKYYRLNAGMLERVKSGRLQRPENPDAAKLATSNRPNWPLPISKDYSAKKTLSEESPKAFGAEENDVLADIEPKWKPDTRTKEQRRRALPVPDDYPSEREFDDYIEDSELVEIMDKKADLYRDLCHDKWHQWNGRKWVRIRDWRLYVAGLNQKIEDATKGQ